MIEFNFLKQDHSNAWVYAILINMRSFIASRQKQDNAIHLNYKQLMFIEMFEQGKPYVMSKTLFSIFNARRNHL
jgi:hypothetical protein